MATSPRPGVIQLEHPNVYQAAKQAQQDNWLRQGLKTTGDALQERNKDIKYQRAEGNPEGDKRSTSGEFLWEGAKKIGSGLASVGEDAWGLLKAPFADDAPMAPTSTEEYRTEVGEKKTSPLPEGPSDIIDRPDQLLKAPNVTTEVDGLPSTQTAEPGVKVTFPTTVAGTVERSSLPDTVVPLPKEKAPETPQGANNDNVPEGMLRAPNWSEMYRIDPDRAKFDYTRAQNAEVLAQKAEVAQARMELMQAKMEAKANAGSSLEELQQLWKENQRGLLQARKDQDPASTKMYEDNIARLLPILQEKSPNVWGGTTEIKTPPPGGGTQKTPEQLAADRTAARDEGFATVKAFGVDADNDGQIDDFIGLQKAMTKLHEKYGVSENDLSPVYDALKKVGESLKEKAEQARRDKQQQIENARAATSAGQSGGAVDQRMAKTKIKRLVDDPTSQPARSDAVLWIMRKNSGAMIGPNEILQYMQGKLPQDKYAELTQKLSPTGMKALLGLVTNKLNDAQINQITADYIPYLDVEGILTDLNVYANEKKVPEVKPPIAGGKKDPLGIR